MKIKSESFFEKFIFWFISNAWENQKRVKSFKNYLLVEFFFPLDDFELWD